MNPTLREVLDYEPFRQADARVVAGEEHLDRRIRWVHVSEMPSPGRLFRGDELLLTQGRGISEDPARQRRWVRDLAEARVAGAAVEVGVVLSGLPAALVKEAQIAGLPLVSLRHPAYFMDMTETVHAVIVNRQYGLLKRAESISREFSRLVVQGHGLGRLIGELATVVRNPVVLADQAHQVMEFAPETPELVDWLHDWQQHARTGHAPAPDGSPGRDAGADLACTWLPLIVRGEQWGAIHVLEQSRPCDEVDLMALDRAAAAIGLLLAVSSDVEQQEVDARSALVHDLTRGHVADLREAQRRAEAFGTDLKQSLRVAVLQPVVSGDRRNIRTARLLRAISAAVRRGCSATSRPLLGFDSTQVVAIVSDQHISLQKWTDVVEECRDLRQPVPVVIGVSEPTDLPGVPGAFLDAENAVRHRIRIGNMPGVQLAEGLGLNRLLLALDEGPELTRHIARELGSVLDHDAEASVPLLPTLVAYLECGGHKTAAARTLNIERRTLYYRLERLRELLHRPLDDPETQASLLVAVRGMRYRGRPAD